jgi:hypothetical protein
MAVEGPPMWIWVVILGVIVAAKFTLDGMQQSNWLNNLEANKVE